MRNLLFIISLISIIISIILLFLTNNNIKLLVIFFFVILLITLNFLLFGFDLIGFFLLIIYGGGLIVLYFSIIQFNYMLYNNNYLSLLKKNQGLSSLVIFFISNILFFKVFDNFFKLKKIAINNNGLFLSKSLEFTDLGISYEFNSTLGGLIITLAIFLLFVLCVIIKLLKKNY